MELTPLANDVYACLQEDAGLGCSNSGLVNRGGGLVVDTFWDLPHTRALMDEYGVRITVPPFVGPGEAIVVNTETMEYAERA